MTHILVFNAALLAVSAYALVGGGTPERVVAVIFLGASATSYAVLSSHALAFDANLVLVDAGAFAMLVLVAVRANRFWPIYESALQLLTVAVHGVKLYNPALADWMWLGASSKLAYPALILLAAGVFRHRRRIASFGCDRDWSPGRLAAVSP